jgi:hypothetical protein
MFKAWVEEVQSEGCWFFSATNNEKMNVVNQKTTRQKIEIDLKKSIRRVTWRDLKKGDGLVVTLFNSIIEQKNDETSTPLYSLFQGI